MPDPVLTLLKYVFLAILYLFFLRVLRAVWVETREPKAVPVPSPAPVPAPPAAVTSPPDAGALGPEKLVVLSPETMKGAEFLLGTEVTVGRAGGCAVYLPDDTFVSQLHARVFRRDRDLLVEDLGSTNGTFLNGRKVTAAVAIRKGDKVQFGRTTLEVRK
ncbi:MAG TPA: FHA domain-containing protein [Acidimicrobiales bacterium]|nr:FHA domain-containing protein [Acidimicrobiales bacterium]